MHCIVGPTTPDSTFSVNIPIYTSISVGDAYWDLNQTSIHTIFTIENLNVLNIVFLLLKVRNQTRKNFLIS